MSGDLGTSIILTMAPIFVLMIGMVVYGIMKNKGKDRTQSKHETDAIIEAQAMLAKYQKEQAEKEAKTEDDKAQKNNQSKEKTEESKQEQEKTDKSEPESQDKTKEKPEKPDAKPPISDTTELEPDIDKAEQ